MAGHSDAADAPPPHDLDLLDRQVNRYQELVRRQASNSARVKTWAVTLVAAVAALAASSNEPRLLFTALGAVLVFALLDAYYLALERHFRAASDALVDTYERGGFHRAQLFKLDAPSTNLKALVEAAQSWSILPFYGIITLLLAVGAVVEFATG